METEMSRRSTKATLWPLRNVSIWISLTMPGQTLFTACGFSVSGIITLYLYPPQTEHVGPD